MSTSRRRGRTSISLPIRWPWPAPVYQGSNSSVSVLPKRFLTPSLIVQISLILCALTDCEPQPRPGPIMTLPRDGSVYSLFPDEDLRTGRKFYRFEDDPRNQPRPHVYSSGGGGTPTAQDRNRNPALFRERHSGVSDRYRFRGEASYVQPNTSPPNANYVVRPLDNGGHHRAIAFDDERVRGPPNYLSSYRNRDLPFDRPPNPPYLPPIHGARRPMELQVPTIHVYDPASQSFVPKGSDGQPRPLPGPIIPPDPRVKVKPGRLLIPGLHNSISSEEAGPETFLNHEEYLDYHTNIELDRLAELDRKMKAMQAKVLKEKGQAHVQQGGYGRGNVNKDAEVVLFKGGSEDEDAEDAADEEDEDGSAEGDEKQQPSYAHGEKSKVFAITTPIVAPSPRPRPLNSLSTSAPSSTKSPSPSFSPSLSTSTRPPEVQDRNRDRDRYSKSEIVTLPSHLRDEASPSRLLQKLRQQNQQQRGENHQQQQHDQHGSLQLQPQLRPKADTGTNLPTPTPSSSSKAAKSGLGTEAADRKTIQVQNQQQHHHQHGIKKLQTLTVRDENDVPSSTLKAPAPPSPPIGVNINAKASLNPLLQQKAGKPNTNSFSNLNSNFPGTGVNNDRHIEIIPSIITQSSSGTGPSGTGDGLIDGHFDIVPGVPETLGLGPSFGRGRHSPAQVHAFRNHDIADDFDEDDNVARFRHSKTPAFLQLETKQLTKTKAEIQSVDAKAVDLNENGADHDKEDDRSKNKTNSSVVQRKMILVKRIKQLDSKNSSSSASSSSKSNSSSKKAASEYESTMTVHKIQESSDEKLDGGGIFSAERATDFNLQTQAKSTSTTGVVSKIHAHVTSCPKLDGPTEIICDVHIRKRHGNANPHLTVGWKRKFYNVSQPDIIVAVNKTLAYTEEDFHDKFNVTLAPGINPMLRSVLLIKHVRPPDTGNYQCEVSDGENHLKSETLLFLCH